MNHYSYYYIILILRLFFTQITTGIIEKRFIFQIQHGITNGGALQTNEFYELKLFTDHIYPTVGQQNPLAVMRAQGLIGLAFLKIILNTQIFKFTICAQKFRIFRSNDGQAAYMNIIPTEQINVQNFTFVVTEFDFTFVRFVYGSRTVTNALPAYTVFPSFKIFKFTFDVKIVDNQIDEGTKYFLILCCADRETNNYYFETNLGQNENWFAGHPKDRRFNHFFNANGQNEITYDLLIINNGPTNLKWHCLKKGDLKPKKSEINIESDEAETSAKQEHLSEVKTTQDLLANFVGDQSDQNQQQNEGINPSIETLNLLDNFVGSAGQQNVEEVTGDQKVEKTKE